MHTPRRANDEPRGAGAEAPRERTPKLETLDEGVYRLLVESVRDYAIFALDPQGRIATWSKGAEAIKGYRADEIIGRHFSVFYPDADVSRGKPAQELLIASEYGRYEEEGWRVRKDGSRFWASVTITALRDPRTSELVGFGKVTRDLTEKRQNEEALRQSEEKFRHLVEGVVDYAIFLLDPQGTVQSWNRGAARLKGYRATEIVGESFKTFYPPEEIATGKPERELEIARRTGRYEEEGWRVRKDGTRFWASVVLTALRDPASDRLLGFAKVTRDLTERKRAEDALVSAYADMEAFSYTVSHDLRAPLRAMQQLTEITIQDVKDKLDDDSMKNLDAVRRSAERASQLVEDLLHFARAGKEDLNRDDVDVATLARSVAESLRNEWPKHAVRLVLPDAPLTADADPAMLRVVLDNLLGNAWKYTQRREDAVVEVGSVRTREGDVAIFVRDNGVGFPPDKARSLFQPFHRLHNAGEFAGTGIGLATVRRIVERHGGRVWAEGAPGAGATVYFTLPEEASSRRKTHS